MKRKNYVIESSDGRVQVKHAWNAALREIESMIRETAKSEGTFYRLSGSKAEKGPDGFSFVRGYREWRGDNGRSVRFDIVKADD